MARGEEQHRGVEAARAQRLAHVAPVGVRQADVEDDRVDVGERDAQGAGTVHGGDHVVGLRAQPAREDVAQSVVVLDDEDPEGHA